MKKVFILCIIGFLFFGASNLSAQETGNSEIEKVQITVPSTPLLRSFTLTGHAQKGAKLRVKIDDKIFGLYRADIKGEFNIGINLPVGAENLILEHIVNGEVLSSDELRLQVSNEDQLHDKSVTNEKKHEPKTTKKASEEQTEGGEELKKNVKLPEVKALPPLTNKVNQKEKATKSAERKSHISKKVNSSPIILKPKNTNASPNVTYIAPPPPDNIAKRILVEVLANFVLSSVSIGVGVGVVALTSPEAGLASLLYGAAVTGLFHMVAAPAVTYAAGNYMDGKGSLWAPYAGEAIGLLATIGLIALDDSLVLPASFLPLIGMISGYELSHSANKKKQQAWEITPTVGFRNNKAHLGFSARF